MQIIYQLILSYQKLIKTNKNVIEPLDKSVLIPLGLTAATSVADAGIHKKILGSRHNNPSSTTLIYQIMKWKILLK